ncbi:AAA family ATPase [Bosea eneae]|uniref:ATP-binding protein n=2 Tax=Bosea TaxID=85413 RepID=A0A9E7ZXH1_9HYPH
MTGTVKVGRVLSSGIDWQIVQTNERGRALLMRGATLQRWFDTGLLTEDVCVEVRYGTSAWHAVVSGAGSTLAKLDRSPAPNDKSEALAFASSIRETRKLDTTTSLQNGLYVERLSRVLPTYEADADADDDLVLGSWLTGGLRVSVTPMAKMQNLLSWLPAEGVADVVRTAGLTPVGMVAVTTPGQNTPSGALRNQDGGSEGRFRLPGRSTLEEFFNDHVVDVVQNRQHYEALGIGNPAAIILEGPPGCGKTVAVERLVAFLGWPQFGVEANSIGSPYIHETGRKVAQLFQAAIDAAPSVVVIDEMDAFLAARGSGESGQHRVEEVAEFLRIIPSAIKAGVMIIGMTNRLDAIDPAILRRGRFDHVIKVDFANGAEMLDLLSSLLDGVPLADDVRLDSYAERLAGRPLSDTAFVVREGARLAAKARRNEVDRESLEAALKTLPPIGEVKNRVGFL